MRNLGCIYIYVYTYTHMEEDIGRYRMYRIWPIGTHRCLFGCMVTCRYAEFRV